MGFKPTNEQINIFKTVKDRDNNILINALAGSGKSSTIIKSLDYVSDLKKLIFVAFNKHIRDELREKLPEHIHVNTLHSLGFGAIKRTYGDSIQFEEYKLDKVIKSKSKGWNLEKEFPDYKERMDYLKGIKELVNLTRATVTMKKKYVPYLANNWDIKYNTDLDASRVFKVLEALVADKKSFDYNDMVYMAATDPKIWLHQYDMVYVDEIQDLTRAQQYLLNKLVKKDRISKKQTGRFILVGDQNQKIYSFTGVSNNTYDWYTKLPNLKELPLTTTFRCSKAVVREAQKLVPNIKWFDEAEEGEVRAGSVVDEATDGDFILCRKESPLFELFFELLMKGKKAVVKGTEMGKNVIDMTKGFTDMNSAVSHWNGKLRELRNNLMSIGVLDYESNTAYLALEQKVNVFTFMVKLSSDVEDLKKKLNKMLDDKVSDGITLMTVHKSKGLEANRVFIIRPDILPMNTKMQWQQEQESNLKYIAITRAKKELIYDHDWLDEAEKQKRKNQKNK